MYWSVRNDFYFVEGHPKGAEIKGQVSVTLGGLFSGAQSMNLDDVKRDLEAKAKRAGCNAVVNFKYGQKSATFGLDKMKWMGAGEAAILGEDAISLLPK